MTVRGALPGAATVVSFPVAVGGLTPGSYRFGILDAADKVVAAGAFTLGVFRTFGLTAPGIVYTTDN